MKRTRKGWAALSLTLLVTTQGLTACEESCREGGKKRASGSSWKCSDGCNTCSCDDGVLSSTLIACAPEDEDAGTVGK